MKKNILFLAVITMSLSVWAQSPEKMSYQAVVRDSDGNLLVDHNIGIQVSIVQNNINGDVVYQERHYPITNSNGLVTLEIGGGTVISGTFSSIEWASDNYFIKTEIDIGGGANYTIASTSQLLSVPYALHAKTADSLASSMSESDPMFSTSAASSITGTDIDNWDNKLGSYTETDPVYDGSVASGITTTDTSNWNNKLDSFTESDPNFGASVASGITGSDTSDWNNKLDVEVDPTFGSSVASGITESDTLNWNNKLSSYTEIQTLADVVAINNSANGQIKNLSDPTEDNDAVNKGYISFRVSETQDTLFMGDQWIIVPGISGLNSGRMNPLVDIEGNEYSTIILGNQIWMAENLRTTTYSNGGTIPKVTDNTTWSNLSSAGYCWYDNDSLSYANVYGAIYNWYTVETDLLCPSGWHVPSSTEWVTLKTYLINSGFNYDYDLTEDRLGISLTVPDSWNYTVIDGLVGNTNYPLSRNRSKFSALPAGYRSNSDGIFNAVGSFAGWWCLDEYNATHSYSANLLYTSRTISAGAEIDFKEEGFSVRCLKD